MKKTKHALARLLSLVLIVTIVAGNLQMNAVAQGVTPIPVESSTPETAPEATPEATPEAAPEATPEAAPEATPEAAPEETPEATPEAAPEKIATRFGMMSRSIGVEGAKQYLYNITFTNIGNDSVAFTEIPFYTGDSIAYPENGYNSVSAPSLQKDGYEFKGWSIDGTNVIGSSFSEVASQLGNDYTAETIKTVTLTAVYKEVKAESYTVQFLYENETTAYPSQTVKLEAGQTVNISLPTIGGAILSDDKNEALTIIDGKQVAVSKDTIVYYKVGSVDTTYTIEYLFETVDGSGFEKNPDYPDQIDVAGKVNETIAYDQEDLIEGFSYVPGSGIVTLGTDASENVMQVKFSRNTYYMTFNTGDGGTTINTIFAKYGAEIETPNVPERDKFEFNGFTGGDDDLVINATLSNFPSTMPARSTHYVADWKTTEKVNYQIAYWVERPNVNGSTKSTKDNTTTDDYFFISMDTSDSTHLIGTQLSEDLLKEDSNLDAAGAYYATYSWTDAKNHTVNPDGSTIVNVYFTRNVYTMKFNINCFDIWSETLYMDFGDGKGYVNKGNDYSFEAKFEQDIEDIWPSYANAYIKTFIHAEEDRVKSWKYGSTSQQFSKVLTLTENFIPTSGNTKTLELTGTTSSSRTLEYYFQNTTDNKYTLSKEYSQIAPNIEYSNKVIAGMVSNGTAVVGNTTKIYYKRNEIDIRFDLQGGSMEGTMPTHDDVRYEAALKSYEPGVEPTKEGYKFAGWYYESECQNPVKWDEDLMPLRANGSTLTLFAKWEGVKIKFDANEGALAPTGGVGESVTEVEVEESVTNPVYNPVGYTPEREGYVFDGWSLSPGTDGLGGERYGFDSATTKDIVLYARWIPQKEAITVTVIHKVNGQTDIKQELKGYMTGSDVTVYAYDVSSLIAAGWKGTYYTPDMTSQSETNASSDLTFTFTYTEAATAKNNYTIKYVDEVGTDIKDPTLLKDSEDSALTVYAPTINGYELVDTTNKSALLTPSNNEVTFTYKRKDYSVSYTVRVTSSDGIVNNVDVKITDPDILRWASTGALNATTLWKNDAVETALGNVKGYTSANYTVEHLSLTNLPVFGLNTVIDLELTRKDVVISYNPGAHGSGSMTSDTIPYNSEYTFRDNEFTPAEGYYFTHWSVGTATYLPGTTHNAGSGFTVYANWAQLGELDIDFNASGLTKTYNGEAQVVLAQPTSTNTGVDVKYEYKIKGADDSTYSTILPKLTNVGSQEYTIRASAEKFAVTTMDVTGKILPADVVVTLGPNTTINTFDEVPSTSASVTGLVAKETADTFFGAITGEKFYYAEDGTIKEIAVNNKVAGTYDVVASGIEVNKTYGNYKVTSITNGSLTINERSVEGLTITAANQSVVYNGANQTFDKLAVVGNLPAGYSEEITYEYVVQGGKDAAFKNVGEITVEVTATVPGYANKVTGSFTFAVTPKTVEVTLYPNAIINTYDEVPSTSASVTGLVAKETEETFFGAITGEEFYYAEDGTTSKVAVNNKMAGTYDVVASGIEVNKTYGNYKVTSITNGSLTINERSADGLVMTAANQSVVYNGANQTFEKLAVVGNLPADYSEEITYEYVVQGGKDASFKNVGEITVDVTATVPGYANEVTGSFTFAVTPKTVEVTLYPNAIINTYDEVPSTSASVTGLVAKETEETFFGAITGEEFYYAEDGTTNKVAVNNKVAGTYDVVASGIEVNKTYGNYKVTSITNGSLTINERSADGLVMTAANQSVVYNGANQTFDELAVVGNLPAGYSEDITYEYVVQGGKDASFKNVGEITVDVTATVPGYANKVTGSFTFAVTPKTVEFAVGDLTTEYEESVTEEAKKVLYTNELLEKAGVLAQDITGFEFAIEIANEAELIKEVKTHAEAIDLTYKANNNYKLKVIKGDLQVTDNEDLVGTVADATGADRTRVYNGTAFTPEDTMFKVMANGTDRTNEAQFTYYAIEDTDYETPINPSITNVGTTTFNVKVEVKGFVTQYIANVTLEVTPKTVEFTVGDLTTAYEESVTEEAKKVLYTNELLEKAGVLAQDITGFEFAIEIANEAELIKEVKTHAEAIDLTYKANNNYELKVIKGDLQVTDNEDLVGTVADATGADRTRVYNGTAFTPEDTMFKVMANGTDRTNEAQFTYYAIEDTDYETPINPSITNVGTTAFNVKVEVKGFVTQYIENVTLEVTPATAIITVDNATKVAGGIDPTYSATVSGLIGSDQIDYTITREAGEDVGEYAITAIETSNPNYVVVVNNGTMTITAAPIPTTPEVVTPEDETPEVITPEVEAEEVTIEEEEVPLAEEVPNDDETPAADEVTTIDDNDTPLAGAMKTWSLFDLIMTVVSVVLLIAYLLIGRRKEDEEDENLEDEEEKKKKLRLISGILSFVLTAGIIILLFMTQDFTQVMAIFDKYSIVFFLIVVVQAIVTMISKRKDNDEKEETVEQN